MATDYLSLGSTPADEPCAQVGADDYELNMRRETRTYIRQIERQHGEPPMGARLVCKGFPHDFGTYHEVCVVFNDDIEEAVEYAFKVENDLPGNWDEQSKLELERMALNGNWRSVADQAETVE